MANTIVDLCYPCPGGNEMNELHESNRACWNGWAEQWRRRADERGIWQKCHRNPSLVFSPNELRFLGGVEAKRACVLGSGDKAGGVLISLDDVTQLQEKEIELRRSKEEAEEANRA